MTAQEELARRIERDSICRAVQKKIDEGKADLTDTARYNDRAAELLGEVLAAYVPDMPPDERETLCKALLRQRYLDTNAMLNAVQRTLDAAQGLHLAPQIADYPEERVEQAAHALADETVPMETIQRRAKSAPATIARSFQDDYIAENAAFRSSAGLKCYINRIAAGGCCKWCTAMAGRYRYGEEPEDVYRRHDNCSCTVTYESGRQRQDVRSKRTWEVPGIGAGASKPTVFSAEQAKALQANAQLYFPSERGISGKHETRTSENTVDINNLKSDEYKHKFKGITGNPAVDRQLYVQAVAQLTHRNGSYGEDLTLINGITGRVEGRQSKSASDNGVDYNSSLLDAIARNPAYSLISIHNHGTNNPPTGSDLAANGGRRYMLGVVVTHNGRVFTYKAGSTPFLSSSFDARVDKIRGQGYNEFDAIVEALNQYKEEYGIEWSER